MGGENRDGFTSLTAVAGSSLIRFQCLASESEINFYLQLSFEKISVGFLQRVNALEKVKGSTQKGKFEKLSSQMSLFFSESKKKRR